MLAPFIGTVRALSCLPWRSTGRRSPQEFLPSGLESFRRRRLSAARSTLAPLSSSRRSASPAASAPAPTGSCSGDCWARIDFIVPPLCSRLGVPLPYDAGEPSLSAGAIADPPVYDRARAAARYSSTMRDLIQSFKYGDRHEGVPLFGRWMAAAGAELLAGADVIVPVPLYRSRLWSRRFNQSAMLAQEVGKLAGVPVDCFLLARVKRTQAQVGLTAAQRRKNVAGAFRAT